MNRITVQFSIRIPNNDGFGGSGWVQCGRKSYATQATADRAIAKFKAEHGANAVARVS